MSRGVSRAQREREREGKEREREKSVREELSFVKLKPYEKVSVFAQTNWIIRLRVCTQRTGEQTEDAPRETEKERE